MKSAFSSPLRSWSVSSTVAVSLVSTAALK
jgi:hypothetical protein